MTKPLAKAVCLGLLLAAPFTAGTQAARIGDITRLSNERDTLSLRLARDANLTMLVLLMALTTLAVFATLALRQVLRSARRLSRAEAQIRSIADSVPALITAFDSDRRMTFVNAHAAETYGRNREELLGKTVGDVRGQAKAAEAVRPGRAPRSEDQHQYRCGRPECGRHHAPGTDCPCRPSAVPGQARGAESICRIRRQGFLIASI